MRLIIKRRSSDGERPAEDAANGGEKQQLVHLLPCKIHPGKTTDGSHTLTAPVDRYFRPYAVAAAPGENGSDGSKSWRASLRGKPLTGVELGMPDGYVGVLCTSGSTADRNGQEDLAAADRNGQDLTAEDRNGQEDLPAEDPKVGSIVGQVTERMTYWNWDRLPTREDPLLSALDWVRVSEAIMSDNNA